MLCGAQNIPEVANFRSRLRCNAAFGIRVPQYPDHGQGYPAEGAHLFALALHLQLFPKVSECPQQTDSVGLKLPSAGMNEQSTGQRSNTQRNPTNIK